MFQLLLTVISYGAFLVLLMPPSGTGILAAGVLFVLGTGFIAYKKVYRAVFQKGKNDLLFLASTLMAISFGLLFVNRWFPSSKMQLIASMLHMAVGTALFLFSIALSSLSLHFIYIGLQEITNQDNFIPSNPIYIIFPAAITVIIAQIMIELPILSMGVINFMWGVLIVSTVILLLYCISHRIMLSVLLGAGIFIVISTINVYVYRFRGRLFEPLDILSAGTAMNVVENYSLLPVPLSILACWGIFFAILTVLRYLQRKYEPNLTVKRQLVLLIVCAVSFVSIFSFAFNLKKHDWYKDGAYFNGYILDFVSKSDRIIPLKPKNYSSEQVARLAGQYEAESNKSGIHPSKPPHIIAIMDEAFSDLHIAGDFSTNREIFPFISSLQENTISGYTLVSVHGGHTSNSEYEFLTGNSLAWLSHNVVPYQQYVRSATYSMVSWLKSSYDYKCVAMHPFHSSGWNRPTAYSHLGFDECYFLEDFPQKNLIREFVSDQEMFEFLIETYEAQKAEPLFLFGVTMQNHGGYNYTGPNYTQSVSLKDCDGEFPEVEQYLSLIHETDKAVEYLITYFENVEENVIIVFYGDHQPNIDKSFYETISGTSATTLDEQQKRYQVPFFIWANYDIEEKELERTSLNYLSSYVYETAGIPLPPYNRFLREMESVIPAINANGYYSLTKGCYLPVDEAEDEELHWLELYEALQYNSIFDQANRNTTLFPALE